MYPNQNPADTYKRQGVLTANPAELIVMLYDGGIRQLRIGVLAVNKKDFERANICFQKAQRIIGELAASLDMRYEISKDLMHLYEYMVEEIVTGNEEKNIARIEGVTALLLDLKEAWVQVAKSGAGAVAAAEAQA